MSGRTGRGGPVGRGDKLSVGRNFSASVGRSSGLKKFLPEGIALLIGFVLESKSSLIETGFRLAALPGLP